MLLSLIALHQMRTLNDAFFIKKEIHRVRYQSIHIYTHKDGSDTNTYVCDRCLCSKLLVSDSFVCLPYRTAFLHFFIPWISHQLGFWYLQCALFQFNILIMNTKSLLNDF